MTEDHALSVDVRYTSMGRSIHETPLLVFTCPCGWEQIAYGPCTFTEATAEHDRVVGR